MEKESRKEVKNKDDDRYTREKMKTEIGAAKREETSIHRSTSPLLVLLFRFTQDNGLSENILTTVNI